MFLKKIVGFVSQILVLREPVLSKLFRTEDASKSHSGFSPYEPSSYALTKIIGFVCFFDHPTPL